MGRAVITRHPSPDMDGDPVDVFPGDATLQRWVVDATFLQQLGLPHAGQAIGGPQEVDSLYDLVSDHLRAQGMARPVAPEGTSHELALKLPGLPLHLRLTDLSREEIVLFVTAALVIARSAGGLASGVVT